MFNFVILVTVICVVFGQDEIEDKCFNLRKCTHCCNFWKSFSSKLHQNVDLCRKTTPDEPCEFENCLVKKGGFLMDDGQIDKDKLSAEIKDMFTSNQDLSEIIQSSCIYTNWEKTGPLDKCDIAKVALCIKFQILANCPDWIDSDACKEQKSLIEECKNKFTYKA